jgi:NodT family efflux transporter outer membrane factor (OMF) lipoprotein
MKFDPWPLHGRVGAGRHTIAVRGMRSIAILSGLTLALWGCAPLPPQHPPALSFDVPAAWSQADAPALRNSSSLVQWWLRLHDPLLARLVGQALQSNNSVIGAQAALRQARALRDVAAAALRPALNGSASAQRGKSGNNSAVNSFQVGLDASWELDVFGAVRSAVQAGDAAARASAASLGDVQVSVAAEVALDYIALRGAQARLAIAIDNLASQQDTAQITQWRLQAGLVSSLEAEQARTAAEQTSAQVPALRTGIEQTLHALAVLTGQPPPALSAVLAAAAPVPQAADDLALNIPAQTLRQRPDVRAAEHQVVAAMARVSQAQAQSLPDFRLSGALSANGLVLGALTHGGSVVSALVAGVSMPLFDGGAAQAQVRSQQAAVEQAHAGYQAAVLTALTDVEDALVALRGDRERLLHLQQAAQAAANAALYARQSYTSGIIDFQTVLQTQRTQLGAQDSEASAQADLASDHVRLYKALGGGWQPADSDTASVTTNAEQTQP